VIVAVLAHIWAAIETTRASWRAARWAIGALDAVERAYAARTMPVGGVLIALYVIYHLLDLTFGRVTELRAGDVYHNVVASCGCGGGGGVHRAMVGARPAPVPRDVERGCNAGLNRRRPSVASRRGGRQSRY